MGGRRSLGAFLPPARPSSNAMCRETRRSPAAWGWGQADITIEKVMTHAEAAANRDGRSIAPNQLRPR